MTKTTSALTLPVMGALFQACAHTLRPLDALVCERRKSQKVKSALTLTLVMLAAALRKVTDSATVQASALKWAEEHLSKKLPATVSQSPEPVSSDTALRMFEEVVALMHLTAKSVLNQVTVPGADGASLSKAWGLVLVEAPSYAPESYWLVACRTNSRQPAVSAYLRELRNLTPTPSFSKHDFFDQAHGLAWLHCKGCRVIRVPTAT